MPNTGFGLEFEYHNGSKKKKWFSEAKQKSEFSRWAALLNKPGYKDPQVKSVMKIYK
jgi:hypothetical protein